MLSSVVHSRICVHRVGAKQLERDPGDVFFNRLFLTLFVFTVLNLR
jgi:hypothetical protein